MKGSTTMINRSRLIILTLFSALILPVAPSAYADPPSWAPAHGWRKKHDPYYVGYSGKEWGRDYGVISGECNWQAVGTVVGGVIGGAVGASVGKEDKAIAVILGSVIGAVIGNRIGKSIDDNDRGCIGHALELAHDRQTVRWVNPETNINYRVTPISGFTDNGRKCREYMLYMSGNGEDESLHEKACLVSKGTWKPI
jgi:surface antigen